MIIVTLLNNKSIVINANLIETIENVPDTKISLTTGKFYLVLETRLEIIKKVIEYKQKIFMNLNKTEEV